MSSTVYLITLTNSPVFLSTQDSLFFYSRSRKSPISKKNMSTKSRRRVSFSPDTNVKLHIQSEFLNDPKARMLRSGIRSDYKMEVGFIAQLKAKLSRALCFACLVNVGSNRRRSLRRVSASSLTRSRSYAEPSVDSHRAEAVEDCIEFLNASSFSNFQRSSSVR